MTILPQRDWGEIIKKHGGHSEKVEIPLPAIEFPPRKTTRPYEKPKPYTKQTMYELPKTYS